MFPDLKSNLQELTLTPIWINVLEKPTEIANFFFFFCFCSHYLGTVLKLAVLPYLVKKVFIFE